ncbi:hypothetical protein SAMN04489761_3419 [Tenacibaculum sp. MAR_2009_124]|uniref:hypothetical protein n=1 Tax=Tenacibaculum sp. MAR_2009_124 TaxID=1250059 RepID=UPI0008945482|nr:hypothetical protein [Tenacibaculum sp. MAR_2009_124]SEC65770.1 hypothetical protein SAMN04489761_3419 [Tenacibaculum sp. MAR_2009_124]
MCKKYKTETLLKRLEKYDNLYYDQITSYNDVGFGYSMRAYHRLKNWNPPYQKTKEKAKKIKDELDNRKVLYNTSFV